MSQNSASDAAASTPQFYSLSELATLIGKSSNLLHRRLTENPPVYEIRFAHREGRQWVFPRDKIDAAIQKGESILVKLPPMINPEQTTSTMEDAVPKDLPPGVLKRGRMYYVRKQVNGKRVHFPAGTDIASAKKLMNILQVHADAGLVPVSIDTTKPIPVPTKTMFNITKAKTGLDIPTFEVAAKELYDKKLQTKRSGKTMYKYLKQFIAVYGKRRLDDILWTEIETYQQDREKVVKPSTLRKELIMISAVYNRQIKKGVVTTNPIKSLEMPEVNDSRDRILTEDEFDRLLGASWKVVNRGKELRVRVKPHLQLALLIADCTAMRQGEILNMKWSDLSLERNEYLVPESKTDKTRTVPIHPELVKVLKEIPRTSEYIISWRGKPITGSIHHGLYLAMTAAKISDFRFHDLRHRGITRWCQMGKPTNVIMAAPGHRGVTIFLRYANLRGSDTQMLIEGTVHPLAIVTYARFMELYKKPLTEPWVE